MVLKYNLSDKGSITVYLLIGISLVITVSIIMGTIIDSSRILLKSNSLTSETFDNVRTSFEIYMNGCIEEGYLLAVNEIGLSEDTKNVFTGIVKGSITACMDSYFQSLKNRGLEISPKNLELNVNIFPETVTITANYPINLKFKSQNYDFNLVTRSFPRRSFVNIAGGIAEKEYYLISPDRRTRIVIHEGTTLTNIQGSPIEMPLLYVEDRNYEGLNNNYVIGETLYHIEPAGIVFSKPVTIEIRFRPDEVQDAESALATRIGWLWKDANVWLMKPSKVEKDGDTYIVSSEIDHSEIIAALSGKPNPKKQQVSSFQTITGNQIAEIIEEEIMDSFIEIDGGCAAGLPPHFPPNEGGGEAIFQKWVDTDLDFDKFSGRKHELDSSEGVHEPTECKIDTSTFYVTEEFECKLEGNKFVIKPKEGLGIAENGGNYGSFIQRDGLIEKSFGYKSYHKREGITCCCIGNSCQTYSGSCDELESMSDEEYDEIGFSEVAQNGKYASCWGGMAELKEGQIVLKGYEKPETVGGIIFDPPIEFSVSVAGDACINDHGVSAEDAAIANTATERLENNPILASLAFEVLNSFDCKAKSKTGDICECSPLDLLLEGNTLVVKMNHVSCDNSAVDLVSELENAKFVLKEGVNTGLDSSRICFTKGTKVSMIEGEKNIEEIKPGDVVMSYNTTSGTIVPNVVLNTYIRETDELLYLELENKIKLEVTPDHPFFDGNLFKPIIDFNEGDLLYAQGLNGIEAVKIKKSELKKIPYTEVYNIKVANNFNYFANGVLNHNIGYITVTPEQKKLCDTFGIPSHICQDFSSCTNSHDGIDSNGNVNDGEEIHTFFYCTCIAGELSDDCNAYEEENLNGLTPEQAWECFGNGVNIENCKEFLECEGTSIFCACEANQMGNCENMEESLFLELFEENNVCQPLIDAGIPCTTETYLEYFLECTENSANIDTCYGYAGCLTAEGTESFCGCVSGGSEISDCLEEETEKILIEAEQEVLVTQDGVFVCELDKEECTFIEYEDLLEDDGRTIKPEYSDLISQITGETPRPGYNPDEISLQQLLLQDPSFTNDAAAQFAASIEGNLQETPVYDFLTQNPVTEFFGTWIANNYINALDIIYGEEIRNAYINQVVTGNFQEAELFNTGITYNPDLFGNYVNACQGGNLADCQSGSVVLGGAAMAVAGLIGSVAYTPAAIAYYTGGQYIISSAAAATGGALSYLGSSISNAVGGIPIIGSSLNFLTNAAQSNFGQTAFTHLGSAAMSYFYVYDMVQTGMPASTLMILDNEMDIFFEPAVVSFVSGLTEELAYKSLYEIAEGIPGAIDEDGRIILSALDINDPMIKKLLGQLGMAVEDAGTGYGTIVFYSSYDDFFTAGTHNMIEGISNQNNPFDMQVYQELREFAEYIGALDADGKIMLSKLDLSDPPIQEALEKLGMQVIDKGNGLGDVTFLTPYDELFSPGTLNMIDASTLPEGEIPMDNVAYNFLMHQKDAIVNNKLVLSELDFSNKDVINALNKVGIFNDGDRIIIKNADLPNWMIPGNLKVVSSQDYLLYNTPNNAILNDVLDDALSGLKQTDQEFVSDVFLRWGEDAYESSRRLYLKNKDITAAQMLVKADKDKFIKFDSPNFINDLAAAMQKTDDRILRFREMGVKIRDRLSFFEMGDNVFIHGSGGQLVWDPNKFDPSDIDCLIPDDPNFIDDLNKLFTDYFTDGNGNNVEGVAEFALIRNRDLTLPDPIPGQASWSLGSKNFGWFKLDVDGYVEQFDFISAGGAIFTDTDGSVFRLITGSIDNNGNLLKPYAILLNEGSSPKPPLGLNFIREGQAPPMEYIPHAVDPVTGLKMLSPEGFYWKMKTENEVFNGMLNYVKTDKGKAYVESITDPETAKFWNEYWICKKARSRCERVINMCQDFASQISACLNQGAMTLAQCPVC